MNNNPFKPEHPKIPGVSPRDEAVYQAPPPSAVQKPMSARFSITDAATLGDFFRQWCGSGV